MSALRLDLIVRRYEQPTKVETESRSSGGFGVVSATYTPQPPVDRWTWRLWSGSRIVSTSGSQLYSRRIDCARGAEVGAGIVGIREALGWLDQGDARAYAYRMGLYADVEVRVIDERVTT